MQRLETGDCETPGDLAAHWAFSYDGDGVRTNQVYIPYVEGEAQTPVLTTYYFGGMYEVTGQAVRKYYAIAGHPSTGSGRAVAMDDGDGLKYFLTDHLGSVLSVLDSSGEELSKQRYLPFGQVREDVGTVTETDFGFTFQRAMSSELGLLDYRSRMYSSRLGRFVSPDSIIPGVANPQAFNRYSYVENSPINYSDPSGHSKRDSTKSWFYRAYGSQWREHWRAWDKRRVKPPTCDELNCGGGANLVGNETGTQRRASSGSSDFIMLGSERRTHASGRYAQTSNLPLNTFFIDGSAFIRLPIGVSINAGLAIDLRPINAFVDYLKRIGGPESIRQLPRQFAQFITGVNIGLYGKGTVTAGVEAAASAGATFGTTTRTIDDYAGITTIADELTVHGVVCPGLCVGITGSDILKTPNDIDSGGIYVGYGAGAGLGVDLVAATDWIAWGRLDGSGCLQVPFIGPSTGDCP